ncbi:hemin uptake protein HemP [Amaricoccus tamworthensis]|uniref:hemin uptake protein HemP n=1 Tax=Amaricoccus tamworthensis TaxID=57002 RepID=UPI003C7ABF8F
MNMRTAPEILKPTRESLAPATPAWNATDLTRGGVQARIVLDDKTYTLRITRAGKLILTK